MLIFIKEVFSKYLLSNKMKEYHLHLTTNNIFNDDDLILPTHCEAGIIITTILHIRKLEFREINLHNIRQRFCCTARLQIKCPTPTSVFLHSIYHTVHKSPSYGTQIFICLFIQQTTNRVKPCATYCARFK